MAQPEFQTPAESNDMRSFRKLWIGYSLGFLLTMTTASAAKAATLTVMWDQSPESNVAGYLVYVGTQSGVYGTTYDVGNVTSFAYPYATIIPVTSMTFVMLWMWRMVMKSSR